MYSPHRSKSNIVVLICFSFLKLQRHVDIYTVNNDITYADRFRLNRLAFGPFTYSLQRAAKDLYNDTLDLHICGKPSKLTYDYASKKLHKLSIKRDKLKNLND